MEIRFFNSNVFFVLFSDTYKNKLFLLQKKKKKNKNKGKKGIRTLKRLIVLFRSQSELPSI